MEYAEWALRGDGPALYARPTPIDCEASEDDPEYIVSSVFDIDRFNCLIQSCEIGTGWYLRVDICQGNHVHVH